MFGKSLPRWFLLLGLLLLLLRVGYKYYRSRQRPAYEAQMQGAQARGEELAERIKADQAARRAGGARVVVADSAVLAADSAQQGVGQ